MTINQTDGLKRKYEISSDVVVVRSDGKTAISDFKAGEVVIAEIVNDKIARITHSNNVYGFYVEAKIGTPTSSTAFLVTVEVNGIKQTFELLPEAKIIHDGKAALLSGFSVGDNIVAKLRDGKIYELTGTSNIEYMVVSVSSRIPVRTTLQEWKRDNYLHMA